SHLSRQRPSSRPEHRPRDDELDKDSFDGDDPISRPLEGLYLRGSAVLLSLIVHAISSIPCLLSAPSVAGHAAPSPCASSLSVRVLTAVLLWM
ncbi:MAG: hypothetical protein AABZ10_09680, partial [Nitrospirota bacterium]